MPKNNHCPPKEYFQRKAARLWCLRSSRTSAFCLNSLHCVSCFLKGKHEHQKSTLILKCAAAKEMASSPTQRWEVLCFSRGWGKQKLTIKGIKNAQRLFAQCWTSSVNNLPPPKKKTNKQKHEHQTPQTKQQLQSHRYSGTARRGDTAREDAEAYHPAHKSQGQCPATHLWSAGTRVAALGFSRKLGTASREALHVPGQRPEALIYEQQTTVQTFCKQAAT